MCCKKSFPIFLMRYAFHFICCWIKQLYLSGRMGIPFTEVCKVVLFEKRGNDFKKSLQGVVLQKHQLSKGLGWTNASRNHPVSEPPPKLSMPKGPFQLFKPLSLELRFSFPAVSWQWDIAGLTDEGFLSYCLEKGPTFKHRDAYFVWAGHVLFQCPTFVQMTTELSY